MSGGWRRPVLATGAFLVGLYLTFRLTAAAVYAAEDYEAGAADCDDCGITLLLDNIGWLVLALLSYFVLAGAVMWWLRSPAGRRGAG